MFDMVGRRGREACRNLERVKGQGGAALCDGASDGNTHGAALLQILYLCTVNFAEGLRSIFL